MKKQDYKRNSRKGNLTIIERTKGLAPESRKKDRRREV